MSPTGQLTASTRLNGRDLGDEYLFYDTDGERLHVLNETARAIFLLCDGQRSDDQIVVAFRDTYRLDEPTAREDTRETIERLLALGLISRS